MLWKSPTDGLDLRKRRRRRRGITPSELYNRIYQAGERREPLLVIGPPGVGKTYAALAAGEALKTARKIKTFEVITGCKDLTPDALFEARLVISDTSEKYVRMLPSLIRKHVGPWLRNIADFKSSEAALKEVPPDAWLLLIFDEATRATPSFIDSLLPVCNNFQVFIEGEGYYAPVIVVSLGNPAGMDASTVAFSHAFTSRKFARITMYQPGPEEIAYTYSLPGVRIDAERLKIPERCRPAEKQAVLACAVLTLMWGLPLGRKGMACLSDDALDLIEAMAERDPELAALLKEIGKLLHFSCDPRKGRRWLTTAMHEAAAEGVTFDIDHLQMTAVRCLSVGMKTMFSEGQDPHLQLELEELIEDIAERALRSKALEELLEARAQQRASAESLEQLAALLAPRLFTDEGTRGPLVPRLLTQHERALREDAVANREIRERAMKEFLRRVARLDPTLPAEDLRSSIRALAARPDAAILEEDAFLTRAHREFLVQLKEAGNLSAVGEALVTLAYQENGEKVPLVIKEGCRLACKQHKRAEQFEDELKKCIRSHQPWRGREDGVAEVLDLSLSLSPDADVEPVIQRMITLFPLSNDSPRDPRPFFKEFLGLVLREAKQPYSEILKKIIERLENLL